MCTLSVYTIQEMAADVYKVSLALLVHGKASSIVRNLVVTGEVYPVVKPHYLLLTLLGTSRWLRWGSATPVNRV